MGDLLTGINGRPLRSLDDLGDALDGATSGVITLQFQRGDRKVQREVVVRLAARAAA
jgi:S1-C subfamily serine protease